MYNKCIIHLPYQNVYRIVRSVVFKQKIKEKMAKMEKGRVAKIDQFWKDLVRRTVYGFYKRKLAPTLHTLDFIN